MNPSYLSIGIKDKTDAFGYILECLSENPATAGTDGTLSIMLFNRFIVIKPKKKKHETE
jgi:hypothetical protein